MFRKANNKVRETGFKRETQWLIKGVAISVIYRHGHDGKQWHWIACISSDASCNSRRKQGWVEITSCLIFGQLKVLRVSPSKEAMEIFPYTKLCLCLMHNAWKTSNSAQPPISFLLMLLFAGCWLCVACRLYIWRAFPGAQLEVVMICGPWKIER